MRRWLVLLFAAASSCALWPFGNAEEREAPDVAQLQVVPDEGDFNPALAVDDKDDEVGLRHRQPNKPEDQHAFAKPAESPERTSAKAPEPATERAGTGQVKSPLGEHIATPVEVEQLRRERQQRLRDQLADGRSDSEAKEELASNPPAEPVGRGEPLAWELADYLLEGMLAAVLALFIAAIVTLAARFPKTVTACLLAGGTAVTLLIVTQAG